MISGQAWESRERLRSASGLSFWTDTCRSMASLAVCVAFASLLLCGMSAISFTYGTPTSDLIFLAVLFSYPPISHFLLIRHTPSAPSTSAPSPRPRSVRLLFPITGVISLTCPIALLLAYPALGRVGLARHTWVMFSQLVFESVAHALASRYAIAVLPRLAATGGTIAYRLPLARAWAFAPEVPGIRADVQTFSRGLGVANMLFWGVGALYFLGAVCVPFHISDPAGVEREVRSEETKNE